MRIRFSSRPLFASMIVVAALGTACAVDTDSDSPLGEDEATLVAAAPSGETYTCTKAKHSNGTFTLTTDDGTTREYQGPFTPGSEDVLRGVLRHFDTSKKTVKITTKTTDDGKTDVSADYT